MTDDSFGGGGVIAHLSDPHFFTGEGSHWWQLANKRIYGCLSWRWRRGREHSPAVLAALATDLRRTNPGRIVVTGDLTHLGRAGEYRRAGDWLAGLGSGEKVMIIPGNHDAYIPRAWEENFPLWRPWLAGDADPGPSRRPVHFPTLRRRRPVALIGLSTAQPRPWLLATGSVGREQLRELDSLLADLGRRGWCRVILVHHPPVAGLISRRKGLTDGEGFRRVIARRGAELILHGHTHRATLAWLPGVSGRVPVFGVPAASALGRSPDRRARYNLYRFSRAGDRWQVSFAVRRFSLSRGAFVPEISWRSVVFENYD